MKTLLFSTCLIGANSLLTAATSVYDVETAIGPSGTTFADTANRDNWTGQDIENWRAQAQSEFVYLRNHNGGDNTITRLNNSSFSFDIGPSTTSFSMLIEARIDTFWEAGISPSGGGAQLLIGGDFNNSNDFYINFNGTRYNSDQNLANNAANGGNIATLRLDYDVTAGTADLIYDPSGTNEQTLLSDVALNISTAELQSMDQLSTRANTQYAGAGKWTITTIPEPSSITLLGIGTLTLILRRKK